MIYSSGELGVPANERRVLQIAFTCYLRYALVPFTGVEVHGICADFFSFQGAYDVLRIYG